MGVAIDQCFGSALCLVSSRITLTDRVAWHYPPSDTSNGEADFVPLAPSDLVFTTPGQVEVNLGISKTVPVRVERQGGEAFPPGTRLTVTWTNGGVREMRVAGEQVSTTDVNLSGRTSLDAELTVDGDGTPSSGAVFLNVFVPNRDVARGRITLVDLAETVVLDFVPARVQLVREDVPTSHPGLSRQWDVRLSTSSTETPISGVSTSFGLRPDLMFGPCVEVGAGNNIGFFGPYFVDAETGTDGRATVEGFSVRNTEDEPAKLEAQCRFIHTLSTGEEIGGLVTITTDQVLASLDADRTSATLRSVSHGQEEVFEFDTLDQLGAVMATGVELEARCTSPAGNQVRFAPAAAPAVGAAGKATLTVVASTVDGSGFVEPVSCTVGAHGVTRTITLAPVLPAALDLAPESLYLTAAAQTVGAVIEIEATVRDSLGDVMPGVPVALSCLIPPDADATHIVPVLPSSRNTDAMGVARLQAAITQVGRTGLASPVECSVSAGSLSATLTVAGQNLALFGSGFED